MVRSQEVNRVCGYHYYVVANIQSWHHAGWIVKGEELRGWRSGLERSHAGVTGQHVELGSFLFKVEAVVGWWLVLCHYSKKLLTI